jgi:predicted nucleic acid-binding protein
MGWVESLRNSTVGLDTGPLIYYIEEHPGFLAKVTPFFEAVERREFHVVTSFVTLIEVLVHPLRQGRPDLAREYREILLQTPTLTAIPLDEGSPRRLRSCAPATTGGRRMPSNSRQQSAPVLPGS